MADERRAVAAVESCTAGTLSAPAAAVQRLDRAVRALVGADVRASTAVTQVEVVVAPNRASVRPVEVVAPGSRAARIGKAVLDRAGAAILLLVLLPALLLMVLAIRLTSPGPALFTQPRVGRHGRVFRIVKLRTMRHGLEAALADSGDKRPDDPRITSLGRMLRRWSLDELPNLWNVVRGDMSLVGPRPDGIGNPLDAAAPERMRVLPGLTGLWQVSGRSDLTVDERLQLDRDYVERWSLGLDIRILLRTIPAVLRGTGAY
jgi:lipopolysaccharide/colanic/teichoic acid biosynthesis glycosyltransferase